MLFDRLTYRQNFCEFTKIKREIILFIIKILPLDFVKSKGKKKGISGILYLIVISLRQPSPDGFSNPPSRLGRAALKRRYIWFCSP